MKFRQFLAVTLLAPAIALAACQNGGAGSSVDAPKADAAPMKSSKASAASSSSSSSGLSGDTKVASISGEAVLYKEVTADAEFSQTLAKFQTEQAQRLYQLNSSGVNKLLEDKLIAMEAKALGKTTEQYIQEEITSKVKQPEDSELEEMYNRYRRRMRGTFEDNKAKLAERYVMQQEAQTRQTLVTKLRDKYNVEITLPYPELPRMPVTVDDDPAFGSDKPIVTIVEFSEFQCPYCRRVMPTIEQIKETYGDKVRLVFRDFPLEFHEFAPKAAEAGECADEQGKFWAMHDHLFENQRALTVEDLKGHAKTIGLDTDAFNSCLESGKFAAEVQKDLEDGKALGVTGTPTFFINGQMISGALPFDMFKAIIDSEIQRAGG